MSLKKLIDTDTLARFLLKIKALIPSLPLEASPRTLIPDDSDLNDIVTAGTYRTSGNYSQSITNAPTSALVYEPFYLYVVQGSGPYNDNGCYQIVFPSDLNLNSDVYIRRYSPYLETSVQGYDGPVWSDWMNVRNPQTVNGHTVQSDVPANAVFTDTTYTPASATPLMDGTAAVGASEAYAREDHIHPSDSSRFALDFSGTEIPADANLNNYRTPGNYYCLSANASTITNSPVSSDQFKLVVVKAAPTSTMNGTVYQFVFGGNTLNYTVYFRCRKMDLTWTSWADIRDARTVNGHTVYSDVPSDAYLKNLLSIDSSTTIPSGSDLNDYTTAGRYHTTLNNHGVANFPANASGAFSLVVADHISSGSYFCHQFLFNHYGSNTAHGLFVRSYSSTSGWSDWANIWLLPATATPLMDGTASVGTSNKFAREDHVHPSDALYFTSVPVSAATSGQIIRIPSSGSNSKINTDSVVVSCVFADPSKITSDVTWTSYSGYIAFTGICTAATSANVIITKKSD